MRRSLYVLCPRWHLHQTSPKRIDASQHKCWKNRQRCFFTTTAPGRYSVSAWIPLGSFDHCLVISGSIYSLPDKGSSGKRWMWRYRLAERDTCVLLCILGLAVNLPLFCRVIKLGKYIAELHQSILRILLIWLPRWMWTCKD